MEGNSSRDALARARAELIELRSQLASIGADSSVEGPPLAAGGSTFVDMADISVRSDSSATPSEADLRLEQQKAEIAALKRRAAAVASPGVASDAALLLKEASAEIEAANSEVARMVSELLSVREAHAELQAHAASLDARNAELETSHSRLRSELAEATAAAARDCSAAQQTREAAGAVEREAGRVERETAEAIAQLRSERDEAAARYLRLVRQLEGTKGPTLARIASLLKVQRLLDGGGIGGGYHGNVQLKDASSSGRKKLAPAIALFLALPSEEALVLDERAAAKAAADGAASRRRAAAASAR